MDTQPVFVRGRLSPRNVDRMRALVRWLFELFADVQVRGLERLPPGGCVLSPNHLSRFDAPLIFCYMQGRLITAFAADTYRSRPFYRNFVQMVDTIWVHRGAIGPATFKHAAQALREGHAVGVAPEGTRSPTRALQAGKPGAVALALAAGVPIVPIGLTNTEKLGESAKRRLWRGRIPVTVTFGEPFRLPAIGRGERAEKLDAYTTELMCRIAALLPPPYRGVYADHPRLLALLGQAGPEDTPKTGRMPDGPGSREPYK